MWDLSIPGHKYTGPFNKLNKGQPTNYNDAVSRIHDFKYTRLGKRSYTQYSDADEEARTAYTSDEYGGRWAKRYFTTKKYLWEKGYIGHTEDRIPDRIANNMSGKRLRGSDHSSIEPVKKKLATRRSEGPPNMTVPNARSDGAGSGNHEGTTQETPIDNVHDVHRGPPDYTFASLPWVSMRKFYTERQFAADMSWRMTSVYDPEITTSTGTISGATPSTTVYPSGGDPDSTLRNTRWFQLYAGMYKYYHVVSCRYTIMIENVGGGPLYCHLMFYNDELPPVSATNEDMMLWPNVRTKVLTPQYRAILPIGALETTEGDLLADNMNDIADEADGDAGAPGANNFENGNNVTSRVGKCITTFTGQYTTGDYRREIILDAQVENWTAVSANPALSERLLLRLKPESPGLNTTTARGDQIYAKIWCKLEYLVEFKELQAGLRWPVSRQPLQVAIDATVTSTV